jgi:hypothetical protein
MRKRQAKEILERRPVRMCGEEEKSLCVTNTTCSKA